MPSWALNGAPSLSVCPLMTRLSLVPSPRGTLWNVLLVKENHYPFLGFSFSKVTIQLFTLHLFFYNVPNYFFFDGKYTKITNSIPKFLWK